PISIDDRIILSSSLIPTDSPAVADALAAAGADNARFFINAVDTTTTGVDVVLTKDFTLDRSDLRLQMANGYNKTKIDDVHLPAILDGLERSEEHTSELQSRENIVCRLLFEKKNKDTYL